MLDALTKEGIATVTSPSLAPITSLSAATPRPLKRVIMDIDEEEELVVVEPTDPDEDRLREATLQAQQEAAAAVAAQAVSEPIPPPPPPPSPPFSPPSEPMDSSKNVVTTDPVLLSQIIQALNAKPNNQTVESTQQSPRFLVTSSNNVLTFQPSPAPLPPQTSFMVQPLSGFQAARLLNLTPTTPPPPTPISNTGLQSLLSTDPLLYGIFVNCATSNMITQLANSISASMISFAQLVAIDKNINLNNQIAEITQLISALINLATSLSNTLPGLMSLRGAVNPTPTVCTPQTNPILTSLIAASSSTPSPSQPTTVPPSTLMGNSTSKTAPPPPNVVCPQPCAPIQVKPEQPTSLTSGKQSPPVAGLVTRSGTVLTSVKTVPRPKRFICTHSGCSRAFASRFNLVEHIRIHTGERPFVCPEPGCTSRFKRRRDLYEHSTMHKKSIPNPGKALLVTSVLPEKGKAVKSGEDNRRPRHFCPFANCQRSYARRHRLNQHMCLHTGVGPFYCDQPNCNVRYFNSDDLERHKLVHLLPASSDPAKKHICPHENCGKAYSKLNKLREHVRSHTGERPFVCEQEGCGASFSRPYGLKRHQLTHTTSTTSTSIATDSEAQNSHQSSSTKVANLVTSIPATRTLTAVFSQPPTLISRVSPNPQPAILNLVQALTSGVQLQPIVATAPSEEAPQVPLNVTIKADPDSTPVSTVTSTPPNVTITSVASTSTNKLPLVQRSSKAAATPSASALAEKAIVISGPFGKRRHICPMPGCTKIFPKLNKLREHICRHTGERPYACEECPATFVRMYDLRRHALIHTRRRMGILNNGV
ncbi:unnamed protein product [Taenia asiatica]|uniref:Zinc finger protein n=1 Tax=Taenia asiatica TaxID=60517 RepID=A0A0R3WDV5_TAEAS|nr:unnamed protein product [Taenia asiatica]